MSKALWKALRTGNVKALAKAIADAELEARDASGLTPVAFAALSGDSASLALLLEAGADPNAALDYGVRALTLSVRSPACCALLCERADVRAVSDAGVSALHRAAFWNVPASIRALIARGADVGARDVHGRSVLGLAVERASAEAIEPLLDAGADPNALEPVPIHALFPFEAFVSHRVTCVVAPLALACRPARREARELLVRRGARVDEVGPPNVSPLMIAAAHGDHEAALDLLARGADLARIAGDGPPGTWQGTTAAWSAIHHGHLELASALLDASAPLAGQGMRPLLHAAASRGALALVARLLDRGADPNALDDASYDGPRAIEAAARHGHVEVVGALRAAGAEPGDALHIAQREGHSACVAALDPAS
jgi:cytohesin